MVALDKSYGEMLKHQIADYIAKNAQEGCVSKYYLQFL